MLLTLKPSVQNRIKGPHEFSIVRQSVPTPRSSPPTVPDASAATPPKPAADHSITSSRRGLPPPSSVNLQPDVDRSTMAPMSQLPPAPPGWSSPEDLRQWLQAKAEEDRKWQEEEKTRQESLRLEQRKIEQSMLRDSLQSGVPPQMIPLIFAGISGGSLPQSAIELIRQYAFQNPGTRSNAPPPPSHPSAPPLHQQQPSALDLPPPPSLPQRHPPLAIPADIRRDSQVLPPNPYASLPPQQQPIPGPVLSQPLTTHRRSPTNRSFGRPPLSSGPGTASAPPLSRINGETLLQHVPVTLSNAQYAPGSSVPPSQPAGVKQDHPPRHSPPSLYFHHWVPPGQPPPAKNQHDSPVISLAQSQRRYEYQSPPSRKRKSQIPHQPAPLPSSRPSDGISSSLPSSRLGSPIASAGHPPDSRAHYRQRSDASSSLDSRMQDHREANQGTDSLNQKPGASSSNQRPGDLSPTKDLHRGDIPSGSAGVPSHMSDSVINSSKAEDAAGTSAQP
ncbi:uncharacterized protein CDV56_105121 [Aspergillus thermomutatus]|uniref:Uncharacterized protein n=1 Tax=Aspergillus thermomutatus TaxID=41047 RepID=A0A397G8Z7_ASPTH|nr:uncharacterized protein CDV56_105121 [Aspergillus thermomutatus]RHZ47047.1 hypothetical protein CDV56_105121 [Aspergillus thermomutatus]